jgi:Kef-type K+ transport system membrane component KefB/mannitol/fructose-specific phosphotransferase system IIA component (Ntr-type)
MMMLVVQLGVILFLAKIGNIIFEKLRLPGLLGELFIGVLIGPYLLGSIGLPGFPNGLFPIEGDFPVTTELYGVSTIASIILLFLAGVETDLGLFLKYSVVGSFVGIGGIIFSFIFGAGVTLLFSNTLLHQNLSFFSPQTLFLGIMSAATSVGITARILSENKKMETPEGVTILAGAVVDDVGGIIVLAIVMGIIGANSSSGTINWLKIGSIALKSVGIWLAATIIGIIASHKISGLLKLFKTKTTIAILSLGLALIVSGLFEEAGLAMIIGAYVTGLSLSNTDIKNLIHEVLHPVYNFFVPVFFCVMGMLVDIRTFLSPQILIFGLLYTIGAILAKIIGCGLPSTFFNFNLKGALRIGTGMIPRGEIALIVAGIGISAGFIPQKIFGVSVLMTLVTTLVAPPFLITTLKIPGSGTRKEIKVEEINSFTFSFASPQLAELILQTTIKLFEDEKYYVSCLNQEDNIYQMRKDRYIINIQLEDKSIVFTYRKEEEGVVLASLIEVLADVEVLLNGLKAPLDQNKALKDLFKKISSTSSSKIDPQYINEKNIILNIKGSTKEDIIQELLGVIIEDNPNLDFTYAYNQLMEREKEMSTGLQDGIAIPHAKIEGIDKIICAIGISKEGVDFNSLDGKPSHFFFLILSPVGGVNRLELLSQIAKTMDEETKKQLLNATSAEEVFDILTI